MCALKHESMEANPDVKAKLVEVNNNTKRNFSDMDQETGRRTSVQAKLDKVKAEKDIKLEKYVNGKGDMLPTI
jgi:hypothetical protein